MKPFTIALVTLRRLFRDRTNIFFVIIAPLLFLFVIGMLFGGGQPPRLAVSGADGALAERLIEQLEREDRLEIDHHDHPDQVRSEVERGHANGGLVIPTDYDQRVTAGDPVTVDYFAREDDLLAMDLGAWVRSVVPQESALLRAAWFGAEETGAPVTETLTTVTQLDPPGMEVEVVTTGEALFPDHVDQYSQVAPSMLLLFVFLTSLTGALGMIEARRLGVVTRMVATPTRAATIVAGEALGRFGIALTQGVIILAGSAILFGVDWGDPVGAVALLMAFCLVGGGAAMLLGSVLRSEGPALGVSLAAGLGLAALGGAMMPLELLAEPMQAAARFTPHAWGYEGFAELIRYGGTITDILPQLGVLTGAALVLFALGAWQLRRSLSR